jgi:hypothetical protein
MDVVLTGQDWNFVIGRDSKPCIEPLDCCWLPPTVTLIQKQESNSLLDVLVYPKSSGLLLDGFCQFIEVAELCKDLRTIHLETGGFQIRMLSPPESANMLDSTKPLSPADQLHHQDSFPNGGEGDVVGAQQASECSWWLNSCRIRAF